MVILGVLFQLRNESEGTSTPFIISGNYYQKVKEDFFKIKGLSSVNGKSRPLMSQETIYDKTTVTVISRDLDAAQEWLSQVDPKRYLFSV